MHLEDGWRETSSPISVMMELLDRYGDVVRYQTLFGTFFLVNRPEAVREVLCNRDFVRNRLLKTVLGEGVLSSDGSHWEQQRRRMLPVFQPQRIEGMVDVFRRIAEERMATWPDRLASTDTLEMTWEMFRVTLSSIGRILFDTEFDDRFLHAVDVVMHELAAIQNASSFGFPLIRRATSRQEYQEAMSVLEEAVRTLMTSRRRGGCPQAQLLNLLESSGDGGHSEPLSDRQIRDEILTMVTAGHETTATALSWALSSIAANPDVAERFIREVDEVVGNRPVTADDIPRLMYTRMIINETLRMYPPVWVAARMAARDVELAGYHVPAGSGVLVSPFALHRHADLWPEPNRFDPERFADDAEKPRPYSYIPFFAGHHLCLGKHFALIEMIVVLVTLAQRYRFYAASHQTAEFEALVSLRIRGGLPLRLEARPHGSSRC